MSIREVILDTETTGLREDDYGPQRIISLGVVEMIDHIKTGRECEWYFNPERPCTRDAYMVHRISDRWLAEQPLFKWSVNEIADWIGESIIVAHNAAFDRGFLNREFGIASGFSNPIGSEANRFPKEQWRDSVAVARKRFPKQPNKLDDLADRFGIYRGHRVKHGALKDARILADVWEQLCKGDQATLFDQLDAATKGGGRVFIDAPEIDYAARALKLPASRLTSAEKERHTAYVAEKLGPDAVWYDYIEKEEEP